MKTNCLIQWPGYVGTINMMSDSSLETSNKIVINKVPTKAGFGVSAVSSLLLVIIPKCPICLAAYSTFFAAIGVNASVLTGIRIALSVIVLISALWLALGAFRKRNYLPVLGLILSPAFVLSSWIIETPTVFKIGSVVFLTIMAFWVVHSRNLVSKSQDAGSCEQC